MAVTARFAPMDLIPTLVDRMPVLANALRETNEGKEKGKPVCLS